MQSRDWFFLSLQDKNEPNGGIKAPAFVPGAGVATNN